MRPAIALLCALPLVCGCVTEKPAAPEPMRPKEVQAPSGAGGGESAEEIELRLGRTLVDLDKRVDRYVFVSSEAGDDARAERNLLGPALAAQVAQYHTQLVAAAGDASNPERRRVAAKALAFSDDPAAVAVLAAALSVKGDARLLTNATYALARIRSPMTPVDPLLAAARDPDADVRSNALMALWHVFDAKRELGASPLDPVALKTAMPIFETSLFDTADPLIRANAAAALGALGDPRAVDPLLNLLRDEHPLVRTHVAIALGKLGDPRAIASLVKIIDATPPGTPRRAVILSLSALLEKAGFHVPDNLGDEGRMWERYVRDAMGAPK